MKDLSLTERLMLVERFNCSCKINVETERLMFVVSKINAYARVRARLKFLSLKFWKVLTPRVRTRTLVRVIFIFNYINLIL